MLFDTLADRYEQDNVLAGTAIGDNDHFWRAVAHKPVCEELDRLQRQASPDNHQAFTALKAAACVLHTIRSTSCIFEAATQQMDTVCYGLLQGDLSPDIPNYRYPLSMHVCSVVLGVPSLDEYEVHICPEGCVHSFAPMSGNVMAHLQQCDRCNKCTSPHCGAQRWHKVDGQQEPREMCYVMHDALQKFFYDTSWYAAVSASRLARSSPCHQTAEAQNLQH
jgi:hypothetical protein